MKDKIQGLLSFSCQVRLSRLYENLDNYNLYIIIWWIKLSSEITTLSRHETFSPKSCF